METSQASKKPGRPPKNDSSMSPAQRAKAYRARRKVAAQQLSEGASMAHENLKGASTAVLLAGLARQINLIESNRGHAPVARDISAMIIREICDRHEIKLTASP